MVAALKSNSSANDTDNVGETMEKPFVGRQPIYRDGVEVFAIAAGRLQEHQGLARSVRYPGQADSILVPEQTPILAKRRVR